MAAQENHLEVVQFLLDNGSSQSIATEVRDHKRVTMTDLSIFESNTNSLTTLGFVFNGAFVGTSY